MFKNIEALAMGETTGPGSGTDPDPDPGTGTGTSTSCPDYNYAPNRVLDVEYVSSQVTCNTKGQITVGNQIIQGGYERGKTYYISYQRKHCTTPCEGACCDQRQVGIFLI